MNMLIWVEYMEINCYIYVNKAPPCCSSFPSHFPAYTVYKYVSTPTVCQIVRLSVLSLLWLPSFDCLLFAGLLLPGLQLLFVPACFCLLSLNNGELFWTFDRISESYIWVLPVLGWDTRWILRKYATDTGLFGLLWLLAVLQWACVYGISRLHEHKMSKSG